MSLRGTSTARTICEVIREINDELQGTAKHKIVLPKLIEVEQMAKRMANKLYEYNRKIFNDWWAGNPDYEKDLKRRMSKNYITGK